MQRYRLFTIGIVFTFLGNFSFGQKDHNEGWKAGVATTIITPDKPLWMAGYGFRDHPSEGKIMDIWIKALALQDANGKQSVLITADLVGIPKALSDRLRDRLKTKYNLSRSQVAINTSHTHTGPVLSDALVSIYPVNKSQQEDIDQYTRQLEDKLVALAGNALRSMQPARLYSGNGVARFQVNRRNNKEATLSSQSHLNGPNDYAVPVIKVADAKGKIMAIAFGYACHNTTISLYKWSGDYAGFAQAELEKMYPGATALFMQGCGADLNPLPRGNVQIAIQYGTELAAAVARMIEEDLKPLRAELTTAYSEIDLAFNTAPSKEELQKMAEKSNGYEKRWANNMIQELEKNNALKSSYPYPVEVWKLGEQPMVFLGGEVVVGYAIELKKIFGENLFVLGYSNDVMNYIPTTTILREGGYEGASAPMVYGLPATWKANIETDIIQEVTRLAKQVGMTIPETKIQ